MKEEVKNWFLHAEENYGTAKYLFDGKKYDQAAFFCQQAIELGFKSMIIHKTGAFPKIHDLTQLARICEAPRHIIESCAKLNPAYTATRYPDNPKHYLRKECEQTIKHCNEVITWIKKELHS